MSLRSSTLQQLNEFADVEMEEPVSEQHSIVVVDTNIFLHNFDVLVQFATDCRSFRRKILILTPGVVLSELDAHKNKELSWFAHRASTWLLAKVQESRENPSANVIVRLQKNQETTKPSGNWRSRDNDNILPDRRNDGLIIDCCEYFARVALDRTFLCSADKNLCIEALTSGIRSIKPPNYGWSSKDIAGCIFGDVNLSNFAEYKRNYHTPAEVKIPVADDDTMMMDVDVDEPPLLPTHALDLMHLQVVSHFETLLLALVGKFGQADFLPLGATQAPDEGAAASIYARRRTSYAHFKTSHCLDYLNGKRRQPRTEPSLAAFLSEPYTSRGARRGQDWTRAQWETALGSLASVGKQWEEPEFEHSLAALEIHFRAVIDTVHMRPTGT